MRRIKLTIATLLLMSPLAANADLILGTISTIDDIDYYSFSSTGGLASFNVLASGLNGTFLDSYIHILVDDGSPIGALTGASVALNDDSFALGWDSDGSTSNLDSFIPNLNLAAGGYILAIGSFFLSDADVRVGFNTFGFTTGDYQITVSGVNLASVPEPGTLALLGIGLFGMGLARRKKAA